MIYRMKERMTSNLHGPYRLGYSCVTRVTTTSRVNEN